jgi:hypothetical protein
MNVLIEMSLDHYDGLTEKCAVDSVEFAILQDAVIVGHPKDGHYVRTVEILCKLEEAKIVFVFATRAYPDAVPAIEKAIAGSRHS